MACRALVESLDDISRSVPAILPPIQLRLMSELALVLTGRSDTWDRFVLSTGLAEKIGAATLSSGSGIVAKNGTRDDTMQNPKSDRRGDSTEASRNTGAGGGSFMDGFKSMFGKLLSGEVNTVDWSQVDNEVTSVSTDQLYLALETLSTFNLSNLRSHLLPFVAAPNSGVLRLLDKHPESEIRRMAALTCAKVLLMVATGSAEDDSQRHGHGAGEIDRATTQSVWSSARDERRAMRKSVERNARRLGNYEQIGECSVER